MDNEIPARLTVVETVYHRPAEEEPTCVESKFSRALRTHEQPYSRKLTATEEWQSLDCGWLEACSSLSIQNEEGRHLSIHPSEEEKADLAKRIIEISYTSLGYDKWLILPGESMRGCPASLKSLMVRCQHGKAKFTLNLIPE